MEKKIVIVGAGPCGLGAAYRLNELGYRNWKIVERNDHAGGLSASFIDGEGFTWDVGGHVLFSHYAKFDHMVDEALGSAYLEHLRASWVRILDTWVPYPFQNNLRYLPKDARYECLQGLGHISKNDQLKSQNFKDWILYTFGAGIAKYFMLPYNIKVWCTPLETMSKEWIAERVSVVDYERALRNVILELDDVNWGPNNKFKFPLKGGTGEIFRKIAQRFKDKLCFAKDLRCVDTVNQKIGYTDGTTDPYDILISTIPLDRLITRIKKTPEKITAAAKKLVANRVMVVGIGFDRPDPSRKNWIYLPEAKSPSYRATYFSNYSPNNVPDINKNFSLMGEISYPAGTQLSEKTAVEETIRGFVNTGLIVASDRDHIKTVWTIDLDYAYPVPTIERDGALGMLRPYLESLGIYSRGRFGAWQYEVGNMDHSVVQGVEIIDRVLSGKQESVIK
ncbi:MAG: protoporphyrinogen/coproporphyrinogen oxidase [Promethearchaeota archaeon]|jgi:protoporphyrinogen oxidase